MSVRWSVIIRSFCPSAYVHVKGDITQHVVRAASHFYFREVCFEALINQLQFKAQSKVLTHWEQAIFFNIT